MSFEHLSTAEQRFQASSRQLLSGLVVAMMFVLVAIMTIGEGSSSGIAATTSLENSELKNRVRLSLVSNSAKSIQQSLDHAITKLTDEGRNRSSGQSAIVHLPTPSLTDSNAISSTADRPFELVKLIGRTARRGNRSFCLITANAAGLPSCLRYAEILIEEGQLSADCVSFRIAKLVPADEIWLEVREVTPHDEVMSETSP